MVDTSKWSAQLADSDPTKDELIVSGKIAAETMRKTRIRAIAHYRAMWQLAIKHHKEFGQLVRLNKKAFANLQTRELSNSELEDLGWKRLYRNEKTRALRRQRKEAKHVR